MDWGEVMEGDVMEGDVMGADVMLGAETVGAVVCGGMRKRTAMMTAAAAATEVKRMSQMVAFFLELDKRRLILSQS